MCSAPMRPSRRSPGRSNGSPPPRGSRRRRRRPSFRTQQLRSGVLALWIHALQRSAGRIHKCAARDEAGWAIDAGNGSCNRGRPEGRYQRAGQRSKGISRGPTARLRAFFGGAKAFRSDGAGLGLAIVMEIVKAHGASVTVSNRGPARRALRPSLPNCLRVRRESGACHWAGCGIPL